MTTTTAKATTATTAKATTATNIREAITAKHGPCHVEWRWVAPGKIWLADEAYHVFGSGSMTVRSWSHSGGKKTAARREGGHNGFVGHTEAAWVVQEGDVVVTFQDSYPGSARAIVYRCDGAQARTTALASFFEVVARCASKNIAAAKAAALAAAAAKAAAAKAAAAKAAAFRRDGRHPTDRELFMLDVVGRCGPLKRGHQRFYLG